MLRKIEVEDGKYAVIFAEDGRMSFERYGEPWEAANRDFAYVKLIYALADELYEAKRALTSFVKRTEGDIV